jgi:hypothetical protein
VQGQCGWANINSVGLSVCCGTMDTDGQLAATDPSEPGVVS